MTTTTTEKLIPDFNATENRASFECGQVPLCGWFLIEPPYRHPSPHADKLARALGVDEKLCPDEGANLEDLERLANNFHSNAPTKGVLLTADHSGMNLIPSTRACGWIIALRCDEAGLWACINWTPYGHDMVNNGEYAHFSTEYDYTSFQQTRGGYAAPRELAACSLTNEPRHLGHIRATNNKTKHMDKKDKTEDKEDKTVLSSTPPQDQAAPPPKKEDKASNSEEDTNIDDISEGDAAIAMLEELAEVLGLEDDATGEDLFQAVSSLKSSNSELSAALEAANQAADSGASNSKRYPNLMRASNHKLRGGKPNADVQLYVAGQQRAINSQENDMVNYVNQYIGQEETRLGRKLNASEYSGHYREAIRHYKTQH